MTGFFLTNGLENEIYNIGYDIMNQDNKDKGVCIMKRLILICLISITSTILFTQVPDWLWATRASGVSGSSQSVTVDNLGNHYIIGYYGVAASFGNTTLTCNGIKDVFIAKLDCDGNWLWAVNAGGILEDFGSDIVVDNFGNVYVTGCFKDIATFGTTQLTSIGYTNIFIAKLDPEGNWLWALQSEGTYPDYMIIRPKLAIDSTNHLYLSHYFNGVISFGNLTPLTSISTSSIFIAKLDADGNWLWAIQPSGTGGSGSTDIVVDGSDNIFLTGGFNGTVIFGANQLTSIGNSDVLIAKLDSNGNWLWALRAGGSSRSIYCTSIALDNLGNICLSGDFSDTASFGDFTLTSSGWINENIFVVKLDNSGNILWAKSSEGVGPNHEFGAVIDNEGYIYITGSFNHTVIMGFSQLTSLGNNDLYIAKLDSNGNWLWAERAGGNGYELAYGITFDSLGNISITGEYGSTSGLGPDSLVVNGTGSIFVAKLATGVVGIEDEVLPSSSGLSVLSNAYPNPFRKGETAQIKVEIPERVNGTLSLYNLKGQCINTYFLRSGSHQISFDSRNLATGIYIYQLHTPSGVISKKLVLF
ncbi:MAG: T9SS type A sorting domain-containing protein [Candidatus Cloacimonadaceae bacterium]